MDTFLEFLPLVLSGLSVIVAIVYSYLTYRIVLANQKVIQVMEAQITASVRPYVYFDIIPRGILLEANLRNTGSTAAHQVTIETNPQLRHVIRGVSSPAHLTHHSTSLLLPGSERVEFLGTWEHIRTMGSGLVFTGTIRYSDNAGTAYVEPFTINLETRGGTPYIGRPEMTEQVKLIAESLSEIGRDFRNLVSGQNSALIRTVDEDAFQAKQDRERREFIESARKEGISPLPVPRIWKVLGCIAALWERFANRKR